MKDKHLLISIAGENTTEMEDQDFPNGFQLWPYVYAHGNYEYDYDFDIVGLNEEMPTLEGYYIAYNLCNKAVIIHLVANEFGIINGRCCYVDDLTALEYVNDPSQWN